MIKRNTYCSTKAVGWGRGEVGLSQGRTQDKRVWDFYRVKRFGTPAARRPSSDCCFAHALALSTEGEDIFFYADSNPRTSVDQDVGIIS